MLHHPFLSSFVTFVILVFLVFFFFFFPFFFSPLVGASLGRGGVQDERGEEVSESAQRITCAGWHESISARAHDNAAGVGRVGWRSRWEQYRTCAIEKDTRDVRHTRIVLAITGRVRAVLTDCLICPRRDVGKKLVADSRGFYPLEASRE